MGTVKTQTSNPCYKCSMREIGCHAKCERYQTKHAENEARKSALREKNALDAIVYQMNSTSAKKRKKKRNLK